MHIWGEVGIGVPTEVGLCCAWELLKERNLLGQDCWYLEHCIFPFSVWVSKKGLFLEVVQLPILEGWAWGHSSRGCRCSWISLPSRLDTGCPCSASLVPTCPGWQVLAGGPQMEIFAKFALVMSSGSQMLKILPVTLQRQCKWNIQNITGHLWKPSSYCAF